MKKRILSLLLALALLCAMLPQITWPAHAEPATSGTCGENLTWCFDPGTGTLTIEGYGDMYDFSFAPWVDYSESIRTVVFPDGLTSIGEEAFYNCTLLTDVDLPAGVTSIGACAFCCCESLERITIPAGVRHVGEWAFERPCPEKTLDAVVLTRTAEYAPSAFQVTDDVVIHGFAGSTVHAFAAHNGMTFVDLESGKCNWFTRNQNSQNYTVWSSPVRSYLYEETNGNLVRVESNRNRVIICVFDKDYCLCSTQEVEQELQYFGGFLNGENYNFLIFGQANPNESDDVEVFRVVRYTKDWERVDSASIFGAKTIRPFSSGSLRAVEHDDYLDVLTCHQMYKSHDGLNHQCSFFFRIRISDMVLTGIRDYPANDYVGHSFNQFIQFEDGNCLTAQHGDAYPRAIILSRGSSRIKVLPIIGEIGNNNTGVSIGGFEYSASNYLIAGNSIPQDGTVAFSGQRNIFVTVTKKADFSESGTTLKWITNYENKSQADVNVSTPHLVKYSDDCFLLMWTEGYYTLHYCFLDGSGNRTTDIYTDENAMISDCKPIVKDGRIVWYAADFHPPAYFYEIDPANPSVIRTFHNHVYVNGGEWPTCSAGGHAVYTCVFCNDSYEADKPARSHFYHDGFCIWCQKAEPITGTCGDSLTWVLEPDTGLLTVSGTGAMDDYSNASNVPWAAYRTQICSVVLSEGVTAVGSYAFSGCTKLTTLVLPATLTSVGDFAFQSCSFKDLYFGDSAAKWNALGASASAERLHCDTTDPENHWSIHTQAPTCTAEGAKIKGCACGYSEMLEPISPLGHDWNEGAVTVKPSAEGNGVRTYTCRRCGETKTEAIPNNPFADVKKSKYYYEPVLWAYYHEPQITNGTDATHFSPNATCTRAQVVTFLYAAKGKPEADWSNNPFVDVKKSKYYFKPVLWAFQNGITNGVDDTHFQPNGGCTRAQVVTFLWALSGKPEPKAGSNPFQDIKKSNWFYKAVLWAYQNGITRGVDDTHFGPNQTCTRGQVVTFLYALLAIK